MLEDPHHEFYGWIIVPSLLAWGAVLGVELSFVTGLLGSNYDPSAVWDAWGIAADNVTFSTCEGEHLDAFIGRPISAVFSVSYVFTAIVMVAHSMVDVARSPVRRNLLVMLEREPIWSVILALGPLAIGACNFLAFASGRLFLFRFVQWFWWCTIALFAAYLWARLLHDASRKLPCSRTRRGKKTEDNSPEEAVEGEDEELRGIREVFLSIPSVICLLCNGALDFGFYALMDSIIDNGVQDLLMFLLLLFAMLPAYLHWKLRRSRIHSSWWRLGFAATFGVGAYALVYGDFTSALCAGDPFSPFQPYPGFEFLSAMALLAAYFFLRGDRHQYEYVVIVQADHRQEPNGVVSAFFVPADDPYSGRRSAVAQAVVESASGTATVGTISGVGGVATASTRSLRADSSGSQSSANSRRRSSAFAADGQPAAGGVVSRAQGRNSTIQEVSVAANDEGGRRNTPAGMRTAQQGRASLTVMDESAPQFASSARIEGSTSSRTSQDSTGVRGGAVKQQVLKQRPPGALTRDTSAEFDRPGHRQRPVSLDRSFDSERQNRPTSIDRRVSATAEAISAVSSGSSMTTGSRPRGNSTERRLEPRPRPLERASLVQSPPLDSAFGSSRSLTSNNAPVRTGGRPSSASFDNFINSPGIVTAPIVNVVPVASPSTTPRSSIAPTANITPRSSVIAAAQSGATSSTTPRNSLAAAAAPTGQRIIAGSISASSETPRGRPAAGSFDASLSSSRSPPQVNSEGIPVIVARSKGESRLSATSTASSVASAIRPPPPVPPVPPVAPVPPNFMIPGPPPLPSTSSVPSPRPSLTIGTAFPPGLALTGAGLVAPLPTPGNAMGGIRGPTLTTAPEFVQPRRTTQPPLILNESTASNGRTSFVDVGTVPTTVPERRPPAGSMDSTARRPPAGSFDSVGSRGPVVPGRPRRSSVDHEENIALRVLQSGAGRSIERERDLAGQGLDMRKVALRTPEEAREASRRLSVSVGPDLNPSPTGSLSGANMSTAERLAALRAERARLEQTKEALQARASSKQMI